MRFDAFDRELGRWEARYQQWAEPIDQFIQTALIRVNRDGYTFADFLREQQEIVARQRVVDDPQPEIVGILDRMCSEYLGASPEECVQARSLARDRKAVLSALLGYVHSAAQQIKGSEDVNRLRLGLAAASIEDCAIDFRDVLVALAGLWVAAERAGIDPQPHFRDVAALSSGQTPRGGGTPVSEILWDFSTYAVLKECRAARGEWPPATPSTKSE